MALRTTLADARHQQGSRKSLVAVLLRPRPCRPSANPSTRCSTAGRFRYGELLLAEAEQAAWGGPAAGEGGEGVPRKPAQRVAQTLPIAKHTIGSSTSPSITSPSPAALYADLLHRRTPGQGTPSSTPKPLSPACARRHHGPPPRGLLTRASATPQPGTTSPGAQADLAEAQRIAERGGAAAHLADIAPDPRPLVQQQS